MCLGVRGAFPAKGAWYFIHSQGNLSKLLSRRRMM